MIVEKVPVMKRPKRRQVIFLERKPSSFDFFQLILQII